MAALDVESHPQLGAPQVEAVGVVHVHHEIEGAPGETDAPDHHVIQPELGVLEELPDPGASRQHRRPRRRHRDRQPPHGPRLLREYNRADGPVRAALDGPCGGQG